MNVGWTSSPSVTARTCANLRLPDEIFCVGPPRLLNATEPRRQGWGRPKNVTAAVGYRRRGTDNVSVAQQAQGAAPRFGNIYLVLPRKGMERGGSRMYYDPIQGMPGRTPAADSS